MLFVSLNTCISEKFIFYCDIFPSAHITSSLILHGYAVSRTRMMPKMMSNVLDTAYVMV